MHKVTLKALMNLILLKTTKTDDEINQNFRNKVSNYEITLKLRT